MNSYLETVQFLESLQIMPKSMPGLEKIKRALVITDWYEKIDPGKVIVVAGTNGKGSTCAILESLLLEANQKVGFYSSPHLVSTTERIRSEGKSISENDFVQLFKECEQIIRICELSHFEALTLMAGHYYFSKTWNKNLDFIIFEVGLGGTYDATNAFPHHVSVITALGLDHTNILGDSIQEVAKNKFGIIQNNNAVIHHELPLEIRELIQMYERQTESTWIKADAAQIEIKKGKSPEYYLFYGGVKTRLNILGPRGAQNAMTALKVFEHLGFDPAKALPALGKVTWPGRMQKIDWPGIKAPCYLSGDHNPQGIKSLVEILKDFQWDRLHILAGIGVDKKAEEMLSELSELKNAKFYLTETPFKGLQLNAYPKKYLDMAAIKDKNPIKALNEMRAVVAENDLVIVTGSLYLVGEVLKFSLENQSAQKVVLS
jgi:dihydrofolate synthase / folylpolyglutamate synthase